MTEMLSNEVQLSPTEQTINNLIDYTEMLRRQMAEAIANPVETGSIHEVRPLKSVDDVIRPVRLLASRVLPKTHLDIGAPVGEIASDINDENWFNYAQCRPDNLDVDVSPTDFDFATSLAAKAICKGNAKKGIAPCPVKDQCLNEAIDKGIEIGIWGGMSPTERNKVKDERVRKARHSVV